MKFQNNWQQMCIENLEKNNWGEVGSNESSIVQRLHKLRKVPLEAFSIDDIRFMIVQESGLPYLLPMAIDILKINLFAEGNYYEGDLLSAIFQMKPEHWKGKKLQWLEIETLIQPRLEEIRNHKPSLDLDNFLSAKF